MLDKYWENLIENNINATCGEGEQFELIIRLLDNLMSWQGICFNNENERKSYELNKKILEDLKKSYAIYREEI